MASRNPVTVAGNLVADPEQFAAGDRSGVRLTVAENIGYKGRDGKWVEDEPVFWPVTIWDDALGANVLVSLRKGARVVVTGRYRNAVWEKDGEKRSRVELTADEVSVSLLWARADVARVRRAGTSTPDVPYADEPPF